MSQGQSQAAKGKGKAREPPPTLFLHPSPAASHVSLPGIGPPAGHGGSSIVSPSNANSLPATSFPLGSSLLKPKNATQPPPTSTASRLNTSNRKDPTNSVTSSSAATTGPASSLVPHPPTQPQPSAGGSRPPFVPPLRQTESSRAAADRTDALWAEMQSALAEVELSATAGTRVFGPEHGRRLAELRRAQIELAQAWARSEGALAGDEESVPGRSEVKGGLRDGAAAGSGAVGGSAAAGPSGTGAGTGQGQGSGSAGGDAAGKTGTADGGGSVTGSAARPGSSSGGPPGQGIPAGGTTGATAGLGTKLEEETEMDILLARKRREANDRYFQRVNEGLLDVVEKLELVAVSMRAVEQESKDMWFEGDSQGEEQDEGAGNGAGDEMSNGSRPSTAEKDIGR